MEVKSIAEKLIVLRKNKNLTQKQLAFKLNVSSQLISKWERGQATPSIEYIVDICNFFNVSLDEFVGKKQIKEIIMVPDNMKLHSY